MAVHLRQAITEDIVVCPGVYDGISAHAAVQSGARALYMTGAGTTASRLGQPDLGIATQNDFVQNASMIVSVAKTIPVIADADTGFGGPINIARTVKLYEQAGVAALHIEDQEFPKRCGHLMGKAIVSREDYYLRLRAAVQARSNLPSAPLIIARTDAVQPQGLDEAIERMRGAFRIGAEVAFVEGITTQEDAMRVVKDLAPHPVLLNLATGGNTPNWTVAQAKAMGFRIVIFPMAGMAAAAHALRAAYREVMEEGTDVKSVGGMGPRALFEMVGLREAVKIDINAGGSAYANFYPNVLVESGKNLSGDPAQQPLSMVIFFEPQHEPL